MVKSGLVDRPSVSHFRLALHLVTALFLFAYIFWTALPILTKTSNNQIFYPKLHKSLKILLGLTSLQIIFGAFTAGLKAGYIYPTYPKMGSDWIPDMALENLKNTGILALVENPILVQFIHRWLAVLVLFFFIRFYLKAHKLKLSSLQIKCNNTLIGLIILQITLGIFTLINAVPVTLGVLHQLGGCCYFSDSCCIAL